MTDAEREVRLLMLKGFSHKEIAALRDTTEATVRQQARAIYQKARVCPAAPLSQRIFWKICYLQRTNVASRARKNSRDEGH